MYPILELKSPDEIRAMRTAGLVTGRILSALRDAAVPGVSPKELDDIAVEMIAQGGALPSFLNYGVEDGYPPFPAVTCISVNDTVVHGIPSPEPLKSGDLVSIDFGVSVNGWHGDSAITFGISEISEQAALLCEATRLSMWEGIAVAKVGNTIGDIGHAIQSSIKKANREFSVVKDFVGHGIGREMHEIPDVPNFGRPRRGVRIQNGLCIAIEPIISAGSAKVVELHDGWTIKTASGSLAAHWEHSIAITKKGVWVLTAEDGGEEELSKRGVPFSPLAD